MKTPNSFHKNRRAAFTLIELLTAIAIVSILVALSSVAVSKVRARSNQTGCISNLRQIGMAWHLYLAENNRKFPEFKTTEMYYWGGVKGTWGGLDPKARPLYPYLSEEKAFRCPSDMAGGGKVAFQSLSGNCYAMANSNQRGILSVPPAPPNRTGVHGFYDSLQKPSSTILVFEQTLRASELGYRGNQNASWYRSNWHPNDVSNVLMADGHVETFLRPFLNATNHPNNLPGYSWGWSNISGGDW